MRRRSCPLSALAAGPLTRAVCRQLEAERKSSADAVAAAAKQEALIASLRNTIKEHEKTVERLRADAVAAAQLASQAESSQVAELQGKIRKLEQSESSLSARVQSRCRNARPTTLTRLGPAQVTELTSAVAEQMQSAQAQRVEREKQVAEMDRLRAEHEHTRKDNERLRREEERLRREIDAVKIEVRA